MADERSDPHDDKVTSVPLPAGGPDEVIEQENQSAEVALGGGEWPSPATPPTGPAPGAEGQEHPSGDDEPGEFPPIKDTLAVDPVAGGSQSVPDEDDAA